MTIQTKSPLVLRDLELIKRSKKIEVCLTNTTANDRIRRIFEPHAPSIKRRVDALAKLHSEGVRTYVMIAPLLPGAEDLVKEFKGNVDYVLIDRMNYHYVDWVYRRHKIEWARRENFFLRKGEEIRRLLQKEGVPYQFLF